MTCVEYTVIIEPADDGTFSVYVPDLPGCVATAATRGEVERRIRGAIKMHLEGMAEDGILSAVSEVGFCEICSRNLIRMSNASTACPG